MTEPAPLTPEEWARLAALRKAFDRWEPGAADRWALEACAAFPRIEAERARLRAVASTGEAVARLLAAGETDAAVPALGYLAIGLAGVGMDPGFRIAPEPETLIEDSAPAAVASRPTEDEPVTDEPGMPKKFPGEHPDSYTKRVIKWRAIRPPGV